MGEGVGRSSCYSTLVAAAAAAVLLLLLPETVEPNVSSPSPSTCGGASGSPATPPRAVLFNFGDSNSDTGGLSAGLGCSFPLPEGRVFFRRPTGRLCDGRLIIDFLCESLKIGMLSPYLQSLGSDFSNGANFAVSGAATLPADHPFNLNIQVKQFLQFRARSLQLLQENDDEEKKKKNGGLIDEEGFGRAVYAFDIGQNDLSAAFVPPGRSYDEVAPLIPSFVSQIQTAIQKIYAVGGKKFWVHNTGPLGCLPQKLALLVPGSIGGGKDDDVLDEFGCLKVMNVAAKEFNAKLGSMIRDMSAELADATFVYTDVFAIKYDLVANHTAYGFDSPPEMACCGHGGPPYNYDERAACGSPEAAACDAADGSKFVSWDGVHYSDAANAAIASKILSAAYSEPKLGLADVAARC